jgi:hypothetical protein
MGPVLACLNNVWSRHKKAPNAGNRINFRVYNSGAIGFISLTWLKGCLNLRSKWLFSAHGFTLKIVIARTILLLYLGGGRYEGNFDVEFHRKEATCLVDVGC